MLRVLRRIGDVLLKLGLSALAIAAFLYLSARAPFLRDGSLSPQVSAIAPGDTGGLSPGAPPAALQFASADDRFRGSFFGRGQDAGFNLSEVDLPGPCAGAGERHLREQCPDCLVTPAPTGPGEPATLFWSRTDDGGGAVGTVFRDCLRELPNGQVRVPLLSFSEDRLSLAGGPAADPAPAPVPQLRGSERTGSMTLGNWAVTVDAVASGATALADMGRLLLASGWAEVDQGADGGGQGEQRVYERAGAELCVVTLNETDEGFQLVTMMTI